jgi:oligoribonuclease NrnB/cAMP/cGMP phosphodiesterase (DHH superfamily)
MIYIVFHCKSITPFRPCMDGLFAAAIANMRHPEAHLVPAMYGLENAPNLNLKEGDLVYLLDLTYPAHVVEGWHRQGADVVVLDHHKTAMQDLSGLSASIVTNFDMNRSGAMLAWDYFFHGDAPLIVQYVQDRDLWRKQMPDTDLINLGLQHLTRIFPEQLYTRHIDHCIDIAQYLTFDDQTKIKDRLDFVLRAGKKLKDTIDAESLSAVLSASWRIVAGYNVPFVRVKNEYQKMAYSDIAHDLLEIYPEAPFACVESGGGWALRSEDRRLDVSTIAKSLGGGGHRNASGCRSGNPSAWR